MNTKQEFGLDFAHLFVTEPTMNLIISAELKVIASNPRSISI